MDTFISEKRGVFLTIIIFLNSLWLLNNILNVSSKYHLIFFILSFVFLWGIWLWKKWAVYARFILDGLVYLIIILVAFSDAAQTSEPLLFGGIGIMAILVTILITEGSLLWAIRRKWKYFS